MVEWIFCNAEFSLFSQTLCDLPGGPIGPGGPGRPGGPVPPKEGGPGGPRDPGVPGVPGSPAQRIKYQLKVLAWCHFVLKQSHNLKSTFESWSSISSKPS